ncbi:MAG TPA: hypothetical protein VIS31_12050 [Woeseiaceae bacterium]
MLIEVSGHLNSADIASMRRRTVELQQQTRRYIMDVRRLEKIEEGSTFEVHEIGERFSDVGFSALNKTAVIMPQNPAARRQIEFLHTVEINRGRGAMKYVQSIDEAFTWLGTKPDNY